MGITRGVQVTVALLDGEIARAVVQSGHWKDAGFGPTGLWARVRFTRAVRRSGARRVTARIDARDEGVTWVRGWIGPDVDALRVVRALTT